MAAEMRPDIRLKVSPIRNGTVIDHIRSGMALNVVRILGVDKNGSAVSIAMRVPSKKSRTKDIVKVEDRELDQTEVDKIALIAPDATINIIRNFEVAEKMKVHLPDTVESIVRCDNPNCITNQKEPVVWKFRVISRNPPRIRCHYCERVMEDLAGNIL